MQHDDVRAWLDRYVEAWRTYDPDLIGSLFTADARYAYRPYGESHATTGRDAIVADWLESRDSPDSWEAAYEPYAVDGVRAVAVGWSRYRATGDQPARTYRNAFLLRFDRAGQCAEFTEFYMEEGAE